MTRAAVLAGAVAAGLVLLLLVRSRTVPRPEPIAFDPVQPELFGAGGALVDAWADVDLDGDPDRFVGFARGPARLYRNDAGGFTNVAAAMGLAVERSVRSGAWGDYDGDGDPDLFVGYAGEGPVTALFRNDRGGGFTEVAAEVGLELREGTTRQASWIDHDGDGDLDLFLALRDGPNLLFRQDASPEGRPRFRDVAPELGVADPRRTVGAVWFDLDADGDLDLVTANMDGDANGVWRNDGSGFVDVAEELGLADGGRGVGDEALGSVRPCAVDYDVDGDLDVYFANYGPNALFRNPGGPGPWENMAPELGLAEDGRWDTCAWTDVDHDGRPDLYVNGTVTGGVSYGDRLMRGTERGFVDVTPAELLERSADHGATWVDHDLDGDRDLALTGVGDDGMHHLMRNLLRPEVASRGLHVRVLDGEGRSGRPGAEVRVYAAGTDLLLGTRLVDTGSGYDAQSDVPVHVAVRGGQMVDVEVVVPSGGGRPAERLEGVDPAAYRGRVLEIRTDGRGRIVR